MVFPLHFHSPVCECGWSATLIIFHSCAATVIHQIWSTIWHQHIFPNIISTVSHPMLYLNFIQPLQWPSSVFDLPFPVAVLCSCRFICPYSLLFPIFSSLSSIYSLVPTKMPSGDSTKPTMTSWTKSSLSNPVLIHMLILRPWLFSLYCGNEDTCFLLLTRPVMFIFLVLQCQQDRYSVNRLSE